MKNSISWFEIPVKNFVKAKKFYETIFKTDMQVFEAMGMKSAFFPFDMKGGGIGGCIICGNGYKPSQSGTVVYLNGGEDLSRVLSKVEKAGGEILTPKTAMDSNGFTAFFTDTEGNKIGLHSWK